ncbi:MAG: hypothetical protein SFU91_06690 [Chloroherpetonaceae bacterium]|nr:hypothetical protein [Chloroherpetonaceae bacterium]
MMWFVVSALRQAPCVAGSTTVVMMGMQDSGRVAEATCRNDLVFSLCPFVFLLCVLCGFLSKAVPRETVVSTSRATSIFEVQKV